MKHVTLKDVARESGFDFSTVSRALNSRYGVHPETREHVRAAAERLGYRPNVVARGLATGRSYSIGLIVSDIRNPYFAEVARGAEDAAREAGCDLLLCNGDLDPAKQMQYARSLVQKRADGILMNSVAELDNDQQDELASCGVPVVLLNRSGVTDRFSTVYADNEAGGVLAAQYLLDLGHRRIALIGGPRHHGNMADRERGFLRTLSAAEARAVVLRGRINFEGGWSMTKKLLARHPETTAMFAGNDLMAFGAARAVLEEGRGIPEDISLIGFDNLELSSVLHPPLTTIHQPKYEAGQAAVDILLHLAEAGDDAVPEHRRLGVRLVERQSCRKIHEPHHQAASR